MRCVILCMNEHFNNLLFIYDFLLFFVLLSFNVFNVYCMRPTMVFFFVLISLAKCKCLFSVFTVHICCFCESFPCALWPNEERQQQKQQLFANLHAYLICGAGNQMHGRPDIGVIVNSTNNDEYLPKRPPIFITVNSRLTFAHKKSRRTQKLICFDKF